MSDTKECCQKAENLKEVPDDRENIIVRKCQECGCRHIEIVVEPGVVGVFGGGL